MTHSDKPILNDMNWDISKSPRTFIQWKGTDVCMDFHCTCGASPHFDTSFLYALKCTKCGKVWKLGTEVSVEEYTDTEAWMYQNAKIGDDEL